MNNFTKKELFALLEASIHYLPYHIELPKKIQSMIDNYCADEKEIFSCHTGMAVSDDFFCQQQHMTDDDLLPAMHSLATACDGMIKGPGIYALKLRIVKLK